jgi:dihydroorotate dehydrogenase (fumarate)
MAKHEYESISQMKGSISLAHTDNPSVYERSSYMYALQHYRL